MEQQITPAFIKRVTQDLEEDRGVRCPLPDGGLLHIDRPLPFLVVFRGTGAAQDVFTSRLIRSEASVLIATADPVSEDQDPADSEERERVQKIGKVQKTERVQKKVRQ